jgi:hypothetical protein
MLLNCLILGETSFKNVFSVNICGKNIADNGNIKVSHLKERICNKRKDIFQIKNPDSLSLWKVNTSKKDEYKLVPAAICKCLPMFYRLNKKFAIIYI